MRERPFFSWRQAILEAELEPNTKYLLLVLSTYMNDHGTGCYPTQKTLAQRSGLSERAIRTHLRKALEAGWITVKPLGLKGQKWRSNDYRIAFPKAKRAAPVAAPSGAEAEASVAAPSAENVRHQMPHVNQKVRQITTEGAANNDRKVRHQVPPNSPMNSPYNSPPLTEGSYQDSPHASDAEKPRRPGGLFRMFEGWSPREHFADLLFASGVPTDHDWEPDWQEFVLFWAHNPQCPPLNQSQWESKFRSAVLRNRTRGAARPTPLPVDWEPTPECWQQLTEAGYLAARVRDELPKFALYWRDDGSVQRSWNTKFIEWVHRNVAHPSHPTEPRHAHTARHSGNQPIDWNDASWADEPGFAEELQEAAERSRQRIV